MSEFREKATKGLFWSFVDNSANQIIQFVTSIILARLLTPREFGLIGMLTIFIAISQSFIDSGFSSALIRKKNCSQEDYSTIFYFNLLVSVLFCLLLIAFSGSISRFFNEPQLKDLLIIFSLGLIINAFGIIQRTELTKRIDFNLQMRVSVISAIISGIIGITLAYKGYGVWSLVAKTLAGYLITSLLLWLWNGWRPLFVFRINSLSELFSFGSKILVTGIINTFFQNLYLLVIGRVYSAVDLGFFTRADQFKSLPQQNLTKVIERVSFPLLSEIQEDDQKLKSSFRKLLKNAMFISFLLMFVLSAVSKALVITLIGEKWIVSVSYLQWLCFAGVLYPMQSLNRNIMMVKNRSDLILRIEIVKKFLFVPVILIGVLISLKAMIISLVMYGIIESFLDSYYSGRLVQYSLKSQVKDILPYFFVGALVGLITFSIGQVNIHYELIVLVIQIIVAFATTILVSELFGIKEYLEYKQIFQDKIIKSGAN